ncbi:hypothetical protein KQI61_06110 [Anaerocolumna aminovalerica]|uniref:hypothetical protein n=1 Tax=Anaerocolumna aminovalerica TaxID=1527 RepID=UPI001C0E9C79|nr:hypothetical protein [Anaerocolumna aminovalerica]MBU5331765.1 hypothetical protein [Anaerocolumna aminovalerica]
MILIKEKYKIYLCYIEQSFDYCWHEWKWFKRTLKTDRYFTGKCIKRYILAKTTDEAITKYKERYKCEYNEPLEFKWYWMTGDMLSFLSDNPNWNHEVKAYEVHPTFDTLKKELRAEELLEYCKQEMYPIEVLVK